MTIAAHTHADILKNYRTFFMVRFAVFTAQRSTLELARRSTPVYPARFRSLLRQQSLRGVFPNPDSTFAFITPDNITISVRFPTVNLATNTL